MEEDPQPPQVIKISLQEQEKNKNQSGYHADEDRKLTPRKKSITKKFENQKKLVASQVQKEAISLVEPNFNEISFQRDLPQIYESKVCETKF